MGSGRRADLVILMVGCSWLIAPRSLLLLLRAPLLTSAPRCVCSQRSARATADPIPPQALHLEHIDYLVIDEADLILSYGHSSEDIRSILSGPWNLPKVYQSFLMSATMTGEVEELKGILLRNPVSCAACRGGGMELTRVRKVVLKLEEDEDELANLSQYCVRCV